MTLKEELKLYENDVIEMRHELHRRAEVPNHEFRTTEFIRGKLTEFGIEIRELPLRTGACALISGGRPGPTIALRADIDALPIVEDTGLSFASEQEGASHSCGHDLHAAALLGAARYLQTHREELAGNVWLFFQPAEESLDGAKQMIEAGCLRQNPIPENILSCHTTTLAPTGVYSIARGAYTSSCDSIRITIRGEGGHGAYPHRYGDPITAAASLLMQLQTCVSRENNAMYPAVLSFGSIHGGAAPNVVPDKVELLGTLRAVREESRTVIKNAIQRITEHTCAALRTTAEVEFFGASVSPVINEEKTVERVENAIRTLFGEDALEYMEIPAAGSEDFSEYLKYCPGAQIRFGTRDAEDPATALGGHTPQVRYDDKSLFYATALFCQYVVDYLK